jgi:hypothetical protein
MELTEEMVARRFAGGRGLPVYIDQRPPELEDPSRERADHQWQPACGAGSRLARCLEAIRDTSIALAPISSAPNPGTDKRLVKQLIVPIYNLATAIRDLFNYIQSTRWTSLGKQKQARLAKRFKSFGEAVPTGKGNLKTVRDKISAHLDRDTYIWEYRGFWESVDIANTLRWIRGCLRMLQILLPLDVYSWTRPSGYSNVVNLMNVDGTEVSFLMKEGAPDCLVGVQFVVSPKAGFVREARELAEACAALAVRLGIRLDEVEQAGESSAQG